MQKKTFTNHFSIEKQNIYRDKLLHILIKDESNIHKMCYEIPTRYMTLKRFLVDEKNIRIDAFYKIMSYVDKKENIKIE